MTGRRVCAASAAAVLAVSTAVSLGGPALAQNAPTPAPAVGLNASETAIAYGRRVHLFGRVRNVPAGRTREGQRIRLVDQHGDVRGRALTDERGRYSLRLSP